MTNTFQWTSSFFVCSIIGIFCILLATVPINLGRDDDEAIDDKHEEKKILLDDDDPISLARKNSNSYYKYIESVQNTSIDPEYRTVEFWMEARNSQIE